MRLRRKLVPVAVGVVALTLTAAACGSSGGKAAKAKDGGVFRLGITEPTAIDPYNSQESEGILVTHALYSTLINVDKDGNVTPGAASSWDTNADCTQWTFHLKSGQKFSNGEAADAAAFVRGWNRTAAKVSASDVAYHMAEIKGFDDVNSKGTATTLAGATAVDANTIKVDLSAGDCEFFLKTYQTVYSPVPVSAGKASNKTFNDMPIGNGPFMMKGPWQHNQKITLVRNPNWTLGKAHVDEVDIDILNPNTSIDLEYKGFKAGTYDWARIPPQLQPQAKAQYGAKGDFIVQTTNGENYLLPNTKFAPLNNANARQAISWAIDRDAIISGVFKGFQTKATTIIPPVFKAYYQAGLCESCAKQDVAKAKDFASKGGLTPGTKVELSYNTGAGHDAWVQAVAAQLRSVLGLNVKITGLPFPELLKAEQQPKGGAYRFAWGADYPTPDNYLFPLLDTKSINLSSSNVVQGDNRGRYSNPAFDTLIDQERAAKTQKDRVPIIQKAEKLAMDDMALIPLWYRTQYRVYDSTKWQNVFMDFNEDPDLSELSLK